MTKETVYAIIDVETTGGGINNNYMTEICIVLTQNGVPIDQWQSLVKPPVDIPYRITQLTGIDNEMVAQAPHFEEIAAIIKKKTKDAVFVAHNVSFDYRVIQNEFKRIDQSYLRKKLCTVQMARKLIPGHHSYSLGRLCNDLGIDISARHRAAGDTLATVELFHRMCALPEADTWLTDQLSKGANAMAIPPLLDHSTVEGLPEYIGVYVFRDSKKNILYVGKAINIKKRFLQHIGSKNSKSVRMCQEIAQIECIPTGSEIMALLLEDEMIRKHYPPFNRAQKKNIKVYQIESYKNRAGIMQLGIKQQKVINFDAQRYYALSEIQYALRELCKTHELCPKYCGLISQEDCTSYFDISTCQGICRGNESVALYNFKVKKAIIALQVNDRIQYLKCAGREEDELGIVQIKNGQICATGYIHPDTPQENYPQQLTAYTPSLHADSLLAKHLQQVSEATKLS